MQLARRGGQGTGGWSSDPPRSRADLCPAGHRAEGTGCRKRKRRGRVEDQGGTPLLERDDGRRSGCSRPRPLYRPATGFRSLHGTLSQAGRSHPCSGGTHYARRAHGLPAHRASPRKGDLEAARRDPTVDKRRRRRFSPNRREETRADRPRQVFLGGTRSAETHGRPRAERGRLQ
jgi:hypothetical protein